jgi:hypothetical protein
MKKNICPCGCGQYLQKPRKIKAEKQLINMMIQSIQEEIDDEIFKLLKENYLTSSINLDNIKKMQKIYKL